MTRPTDIKALQETWDRLGREDPMWAVASNRESWDPEEFYATGEAEITAAIAYVDSLGRSFPRHRALDFGSGLGRLTRALSAHYEYAVGVDIAPSMVAAASELNADRDNLSFVVNDKPGLDVFESDSFDLVFSNITLQHMRPELAVEYIAGFVRIVSPEGLILFQVPSREVPGETGWWARLRRALRQGPRQTLRALNRRISQPTMEMHCVPKEEVVRVLDGAGAEILEVRPNTNAGPLYESYWFAAVTKT
jgi:SAM-dependent methyltransferase